MQAKLQGKQQWRVVTHCITALKLEFGRRMTLRHATDASGLQTQAEPLARNNDGNHRNPSFIMVPLLGLLFLGEQMTLPRGPMSISGLRGFGESWQALRSAIAQN